MDQESIGESPSRTFPKPAKMNIMKAWQHFKGSLWNHESYESLRDTKRDHQRPVSTTALWMVRDGPPKAFVLFPLVAALLRPSCWLVMLRHCCGSCVTYKSISTHDLVYLGIKVFSGSRRFVPVSITKHPLYTPHVCKYVYRLRGFKCLSNPCPSLHQNISKH